MTPAERYAALKALIDGLTKATKEAGVQALAEVQADPTRDRWRTRFGTVLLKQTKAGVYFNMNSAGFLSWVRDNHPTEVETVTRVRTSFISSLSKRLVVSGDEVVDILTGQVVDWATVTEPGNPYLSVHADEAYKQAKANAAELIEGRLELLTEGIAPELAP